MAYQNTNIFHPYTIGMPYSTSRTSVKPSLFVYSVTGDIKLLSITS